MKLIRKIENINWGDIRLFLVGDDYIIFQKCIYIDAPVYVYRRWYVDWSDFGRMVF